MNRKAKWERRVRTTDEYSYYWFECSNCGNYPPLNHYHEEYFSKYCPYCGCLMNKENEAENKIN